MKRGYELDVYKPAEELSDRVWYDFDTWNTKAQNTIGYQIIRSSDSIASNRAEGYGRHKEEILRLKSSVPLTLKLYLLRIVGDLNALTALFQDRNAEDL